MNEEKAREIAIQILDEFEELLAAKGIVVPSDDREGREEEACFYGTEYYELEDVVTDIPVEEVGGEGCCSRPSVCEGERRDRAVIGCPSMSGGFLRANDRVHPFVTPQ